MARQERGIRSRRLILQAAADVFDERGYDAASTNEILARAGLTRGALYHHFPSKEAIAAALIEAQREALVVPDQPSKLQALIDLTLEFSRRLETEPVLRAGIRLTVQSSVSPSVLTPHVQLATVVEGLLRQAEGQGELLPGMDLPEVASTLVGAFTGLQVTAPGRADRRALPARVAVLWRLLLPALAAPGMLPRLRTSVPPQSGNAATAPGERAGAPDA